MSACCVLTPIVISSWPAISAAVVGAAASMGFSLHGPELQERAGTKRRGVETEVENSEVIAEDLTPGQKIVVSKDDVVVTIAPDAQGRCTVCVTGDKYSDAQLRRIGEQVAGRIVQQFAYNKLVTELKTRNYTVLDEQVLSDESVRLRIRI